MKKLKSNITLLNVISSILLQFITILSGFIIPRIILKTFGSEVNGLISSLNQFLNYINILEGGLGGVVLANLYKPLFNKDDKKISSVVKTTHDFYHKLSMIFLGYTIVLAFIYPLITHNSFSFTYIFSLTLILSITLFIQFNFSLSYKLLLQADKKVYIVSFTQIILTVLNICIFIVMSKIIPNIHILKLVSGLIFIIQPIVFNHFIKKNYNINKKIKSDANLLKERWNGFAINIAAFIHNNTDITILTIFTGLKVVSVYSVYALVTTGLKKLIQSASSAISPSIGHLYAKGNIEELNKKFELYEYSIFLITFFLFTVGGLLITPFVQLYTKNITDVNYNQPIFGIMIVIAELIYCIREPYVSLAYSANKFKEIKKHAYIEAILNIILSLMLVKKLGLLGIAIGTVIAMTYRTLFHVWYLQKNILNRSINIFIKKMALFTGSSIIVIIICTYIIPLKTISIINFILYGAIYSIVLLIVYMITSLIFYKEDVKSFKKIIKIGNK